MSRIDLNVVATGNFGQLESQLARLKAQVASLNASMSSGMMINPASIASMQNYSSLMADNLRSTGMFQTKMVSLTSETERFGQSLQRGNIRLGDYFRTATGHIRNQQTEIQRLAREQVRLMNSTSLAMGDGRAMVITPTGIDEAIHKQQILNQEYRIFRQVVQGGSTQLINWGKNTQWAGRQLTVGLTVPLTLFGAAAAKTFMEADKQLTRLAKVYGDAAKGVVSPGELQSIRQQTLGLAKDIAASMGVAAEETLGIAADIAATGKEGNELLAATNEAMRLSVLGEVDRQEAMRATLSIQSVFKKDTEGLTESINFLNAVENQTSTSLNDLVTGIVKAGPVVQGLGGDIEDLALMMVAMREGGVPASEAANAIKSSLASLINPTKQTTQTLNAFGIDLVSIVDKNAGDVIGTLIDLQNELAGLDELSRQRSIEQIFGKFQFSRINALLNNLGKAGSQTQQVLNLAGLSTEELAANADRELKAVADSVSGRFQRALESLKANLIPIGEIFTQVGTMLLEVGSKILEIFNSLPGPVKNFVQGLMFLTGLAGPIIMITGVFGNFLGYLLKGVSSLMAIKQAGRGVFEYFTPESIAARNASELITKAFYDEEQAIKILNSALQQLNKTLIEMQTNSNAAAGSMQGMAEGTMAAAERSARTKSIFSGSANEPRGSEFFHRMPKGMLTEQERSMFSVGTAMDKKEFAAINNALGEMIVPILSGNAALDNAAIKSVTDKLAKSDVTLTPEQKAKLFLPIEKAAAEAASSVAYPQVFGQARAAGATDEQIKKMEQQFRVSYLKDPQEAIKNLTANLQRFGVNLTSSVVDIQEQLTKAYKEALDSGATIEQATEAMYKKSIEIETKARSQVDDILSYSTTTRDGKTIPRKRGAGAGQLMLQEGLGMLGPEATVLSEEVMALLQKEEQLLQNATKIQGDINKNKEQEKKLVQEIKDLEKARKSNLKRIAEIEKIRAKDRTPEEQAELRRLKSAEKRLQEKTDRLAQVREESANLENRSKSNQVELDAARQQKENSLKASAAADRKETVASTRATKADMEETKASMDAARANRAEAAASGAAAGTGRSGLFAGGKIGGALSMLGMISMFLPNMSQDTGTGQAVNAGQNIASMAMMGSFAGPKGAAVGAAIGAVIEGIGFLSRKSEEAAKAVEQLRLSSEIAAGAVSDLEKEFLGLDIKELEELPFQVFGERTQEATDQLEQFTQALIAATAAEEGSLEKQRVEEIKKFTSGEELVNSSMFMEIIGQAIVSGTDPDQLKLMFQAYLDVADKEYFSTAVNNAIDSFMPDGASIQSIRQNFIKKTSESLNAMTADLMGGGNVKNPAAAARLMEEEKALDTLRGGQAATIDGRNVDIMDIINTVMQMPEAQRQEVMLAGQQIRTFGGYPSPNDENSMAIANALTSTGIGSLQIGGQNIEEGQTLEMLSAITSIIEMSPDINQLTSDVTKLGEASKLMANTIADSMSTLSGKDFASVIKTIDPNVFQKNSAELIEFVSQLSLIPDIGPDVANAFQTMINNGTDATTAFKALKLMTAGTNMTIQEIIDLAGTKAEFNIVYRETFIQDGSPVGPAVLPRPTQGASMPSDALSSAISAMGGISTGGGGGGGSDTSAVEKVFDKRIKAQDKIIEGIKKEREERQKLLNLEKQAFDFAMQEQDLKNQIARARAEGRTAEAAMLQAQLDNARATEKQDEQERIRQENEDRRIRKAERTKRQLERAKSRATESSSGGGGGAGGISQQVADAIKVAMMELTSWTQSKAFKDMAVKTGPMSAFFDSKRVKDFRTELEKLNVPTEVINDILDSMFDSFVSNNEVYAEGLETTRKNLEKVGLAGEDLEDALPNVYGIMIDKGITAQEKLDLIAKEYENVGYGADEAKKKALEFYDVSSKNVNVQRIKDIAAAYEEVAGKARAAAMETAILNIVTNNPNVSVEEAASAVALDFAKFGRATGGYIVGPGTSTSDSIPVRLSNGEYVIRASMVDKYGVPFFDALNRGMLPMMASGGMVSRYPSIAAGMAGGGYVRTGYNMGGLVSGKESEYNINVYVTESNASADDIANKVMQSLQRRDKMNRAGIRI